MYKAALSIIKIKICHCKYFPCIVTHTYNFILSFLLEIIYHISITNTCLKAEVARVPLFLFSRYFRIYIIPYNGFILKEFYFEFLKNMASTKIILFMLPNERKPFEI